MNICSAGGWRVKDKDINRGHERPKGAKEGSRKGLGEGGGGGAKKAHHPQNFTEQKPASRHMGWPFKKALGLQPHLS